tara:strand:- start:285 stop:1070 length:786 start_codon:yes stop_codon:yes gene_type:complete
MKIFDCFLYNDENLILDIRFNTLSKFVEKFIIVESKYDHQGNKKKLNFEINNFKKFKDKIIYLVIENFPQKLSNWERENFQRNYIINGLSLASDEDYIIISDADEIPDLAMLTNLDNYKFSVFEQKMYYYKINLLNKTDPFWYGSRICKKKYLKSPQWLRNQKIKKYPFWKFYKIKWNIIKKGGWHFSFLMNPEEIKKKLTSFAHSEYNNDKYTDLKKIKDSIENKIDLFNRPVVYEKNNFDETFPNYVVNNKKKFKNWIL